MDDRYADLETAPGIAEPTEFDQIRVEIERDWGESGPSRIETWLARLPDTERDPLLEPMIALEVELRRESGESPAITEYLQRFPDRAEQVIRGFESRRRPARRTPDETAGGDRQTVTLRPGDEDDRGIELEPGRLIGRRYVVRRLLGKGGCAVVYLAHDPMLDRLVALKMPRWEGFRSDADLDDFIREARNAAQLVFPAIVQIYDVQRQLDSVFIVQQFIDGPNLSTHMKAGRLSPARIADLLIGIGEALDFAHRRGFVHRDIKPANILLDAAGQPYLSDFGLALHESVQRHHWGELAGTCPYMSPEQVRREVHRLDGRSDIWGLGVILYELLTGVRPFTASPSARLFEEIEHRDPRPHREVDPSVPRDLERIGLKCLAKRATERYETASELVDDLRHWRERESGLGASPAIPARSARVVPRGLRSFDAMDADFFLELLPGPRDREGLPESLRFWKRQIEQADPDERLAVCLMYGPSGSGKSSLVKAGLLPRLAEHVLPVYVEATAHETEFRLLRGLKKRCPELAAEMTLPDVFARLRSVGGSGEKKVLVVLDQFEQWLHATDGGVDGALIRALRQCDGAGVQCLLLVRDDFWMSITRFMRSLEIPQVEGLNSSAVDLFDPDHARKVLKAFGRAFEKLPERELTAEQDRFLDRSVGGLIRDGKVISVRLALFAEMMKGRPWTISSLDEVGGPEGVDLTFLEETFSARTAPPTHRRHQQAARAVLKALLPAIGTDIRGRMQPYEALLAASGYAGEPDDFRALLAILDGEVRLITPTEQDAADSVIVSGRGPEVKYYQLTHDFLIPALRDWLTKKQKETPGGRAEIRLEERTALWTEKRERRQLPSWWEWARIRLLTRMADWTAPQREMMRIASRYHLVRSALLAGALTVVSGAIMIENRLASERDRRDQARHQVEQLWEIDLQKLPGLLDRMDKSPELWREQVARFVARPETDANLKTRGYLALARHGAVGLDHLTSRLLEAEGGEHGTIRDELRRWKARLLPALWRAALDPRSPGGHRLAAASALADYDHDDSRWGDVAMPVVRALIDHDPLLVEPWVEALRPAREHLKPPLLASFADPKLGDNPKLLAASILADYGGADAHYLPADVLTELILDANPSQSSTLMPLIRQRRGDLADRLTAPLKVPVPLTPDPENERQIRRQANAAQTLLALDQPETFWPLLRHSEDPRLRTRLIDRIPSAQMSPEALLDRFDEEKDGSIRQAILIGLQGFGPAPSPSDRLRIADRLLTIFETDPDCGVHSAAEWVLTRRDLTDRVAEAKRRLAGRPREGKRWFITPHLHTMIVVPPPGVFTIGSPKYEDGRDRFEDFLEVRVDHGLAVAAHEVTFAQYRKYRDDLKVDEKVTRSADSPVNYMSWFEAARYCRWLSEREGIPESEMCYPPPDRIGPGMKLTDQYLARAGYRLPTEQEWEFVARAGSTTSRFFGNSADHLGTYAWTVQNASERTWPVGRLRPNPLGLFDVYGNAIEWCDPGVAGPLPDLVRMRGGSFRMTERFHRSTMRVSSDTIAAYSNYGFRVVKAMRMP